MAKKKITAVLSLLVLPSTFSALNYGQVRVEQKILTSSNVDNAKTDGEIYSLNNIEKIKQDNVQKSNVKTVKQDLQKVVDKALEDLKNPIDFSKSNLMEDDYFYFDVIENTFINVLYKQIKQKDKSLSIKLIDKNQDLLNNNKIKIEIIGKDDNEEVKKTTLVTPIKLISRTNYMNNLKKEIHITYDDDIFAYDSNYNPSYELKQIDNKIKLKFIELNDDQSWLTNLVFFSIDSNVKKGPYIRFEKGKNIISVYIAFKYSKISTKINLTLLNIVEHPQVTLNNVVNFFIDNGIYLSNEPIFDDTNFNDINVENKIIEIMRIRKQKYDEKDLIKLEKNGFVSLSNDQGYLIIFFIKIYK